MEPERRAGKAKNKKEISFPVEKTVKPLSLRPLLQFCKGGLRNRQQALLMRWAVQIPPSPVKTSTACNSKRNLQGCLFFVFKRKNGTRAPRWKSEKQKRNLFSHGKDRKAAVTASLVTVL